MFGKSAIDDLAGRMSAIRAALQTAMPSRVHRTSFRRGLDEQDRNELMAGVVMAVSSAESDFSTVQGMEAREGTQSIAVIVQFRVEGDEDGEGVEAEEFEICAQIKDFVRTGVAGIGLELVELVHSAQQETPYGYVVAQLNAGPPRDNLI